MKKHKPVKMQPLFRKEKDYLKAINNPKTLEALKDMVAQANHVTDNIVHPKNLNDWMVYVISILPRRQKKQKEGSQLVSNTEDHETKEIT